LHDFEGIDAALSRQGFSETHIQIFDDWGVATALDYPDPSFNGGLYGYDSLQVSPGLLDVKFPTFSVTSVPWSLNFFTIDLDSLGGDTLLFNGDNINPFTLHLINPDSLSPLVDYISLSLTNESRIYIDPLKYPMGIRAVVSNVGDSGTKPALVFSNDLIRPIYVKLGVFQNAQADRFLDLYVFSNERLFSDVSVETPVVEVTQNNSTQQVTMEIFTDPGTDSILVIYKGDIALSVSGIAQIVLTGEDFAGNDIDTVTTGVSVQFIQADEGGEIASIEGEMHLRLPAKSLAKDIYLTVFTLESSPTTQGLRVSSFGDLVSIPEERAPVGFAYRIGPTGLRLKSPARLTIHLEELTDPDPSKLGIYRLEGKNWVYVGGILDEGSLSTEIDILGTYQVQLGPHPLLPSLPKVYTLSQNIPNPMGKVTVILYQLPNDSHVSLKIYNILGQVVKTLINGQEKAGFYSVPWEGKDDTGRNMTSGIYFYTFQAGDFKQTKKLVLLR
ncbi:T9SS type A sorting domain-containing protein, partial [candidate division TA06 bacterium]|nr:T9SS type A sorting domain-containing protein [candidate division TA06 bacterium]